MVLDADRVNKLYNTYTMERDRLSLEMAALTGGINTGSGKQLAQFLFETAGFAVPTDFRGRPIPGLRLAPYRVVLCQLVLE